MSLLKIALFAAGGFGLFSLAKKLKGAYDLGYKITGFRFAKGSTVGTLQAEIDIKFTNNKSETVEIQSINFDVSAASNTFISGSLQEQTKGVKTSGSNPPELRKIPALSVPPGSIIKTIPVEISTFNAAKVLQLALSNNPPSTVDFSGTVKIANLNIPVSDSQAVDFAAIKTAIQGGTTTTTEFLDSRLKKAIRNQINTEKELSSDIIQIYRKGLIKKYIVYQTYQLNLFEYKTLTNKLNQIFGVKTQDDLNKYINTNGLELVSTINKSEL